MERPSTATLLTVAGVSAAAGLAAYELYRHPRLRRSMTTKAYDALSMAISPLSRMAGASRRTLGRRFHMASGEEILSRAERRLRDEADADRIRAMVGL